jgi:hypothetical protein
MPAGMGFPAARSRDPCGVAVAQRDQANRIGAADRRSGAADNGIGRGLLVRAHNAGFSVFGDRPGVQTLRRGRGSVAARSRFGRGWQSANAQLSNSFFHPVGAVGVSLNISRRTKERDKSKDRKTETRTHNRRKPRPPRPGRLSLCYFGQGAGGKPRPEPGPA